MVATKKDSDARETKHVPLLPGKKVERITLRLLSRQVVVVGGSREVARAIKSGDVSRQSFSVVPQQLRKEEIIGTVTDPADPAGTVMALALPAGAVLLAVVAAVLGSGVALWRWRGRDLGGREALAVAAVD
jgi:hypothetical protein